MDTIILAAGKGSRLRVATAKPMLPLAGQPLIQHVLAAVQTAKLGGKIIIVVSPNSDEMQSAIRAIYPTAQFAIQPKPRGTADAAHHGLMQLGKTTNNILILCADAPLITATTLKKINRHLTHTKCPTFVSFHANNPHGYGRIIRCPTTNMAINIVEEKVATRQQRTINEVYAGIMAAPFSLMQKNLAHIINKKRTGEYYLTDIVALSSIKNSKTTNIISISEEEAMGINTMQELAQAEAALRQRRANAWMQKGVCITDPRRIDFRGDVKIANDCTLDINVIIQNSIIGAGTTIGANSILIDCVIGKNTTVQPFCHLQGATVGANCTLGPYARIRPHSRMQDNVHIGNFVEVKNSNIHRGTKAGHLTYLGDADIGSNSNIGAGVITCNYDGKNKNRTIIGNDAFIGSDCQLIAPVKVESGAYVAAGTTLTHTAKRGHITASRVPQRSIRKRK